MTRPFYFLRHGETPSNAEGRMQGQRNIPLNDTGRQQAAASCTILSKSPIDLIVCSDLDRAHETAKIVNAMLGKPLHIEPGLRERSFGLIEGLTGAEINSRPWQELFQTNEQDIDGHRLPRGGESIEAFEKRIRDTVTRYLETEKTVLFVGHGGPFRALQRHYIGTNDRSPNATPYYFDNTSGSWTLTALT